MATCPQCRTTYSDSTLLCARDGVTLQPDAFFTIAAGVLKPGDMIGDYQVEGEIGEGTFGVVYRVVQPVIGKRAAVKVLNPEFASDQNWVARFVDEARAVNQIKNRNIIDIFAFGTTPSGQHYFAMELLEGEPFDKFLGRTGFLTPDAALPILRKIARALDAAHRAGIVHRDLKPENIFIARDDDGAPMPKLLDFGIAKLRDTPSARAKTKSGTPMGTPSYMSPEQCRGEAVDHRTDIYALGVIAHQVLSGHMPFKGSSVDVMMRHLQTPAPPMSRTSPHLAPLDAAVLHMLEKDAARRPDSAGQAIEELSRAAALAGYIASDSAPVTSGTDPGRASGASQAPSLGSGSAMPMATTGYAGASAGTFASAFASSAPGPGHTVSYGAPPLAQAMQSFPAIPAAPPPPRKSMTGLGVAVGAGGIAIVLAATAGIVLWQRSSASNSTDSTTASASSRPKAASSETADTSSPSAAPSAAPRISVTKSGSGDGTVVSDPEGINCGAVCSADLLPDEKLRLTATPAPGATFNGWSGACQGNGPCDITPQGGLQVTATFARNGAVAAAPQDAGPAIGPGPAIGTPDLPPPPPPPVEPAPAPVPAPVAPAAMCKAQCVDSASACKSRCKSAYGFATHDRHTCLAGCDATEHDCKSRAPC